MLLFFQWFRRMNNGERTQHAFEEAGSSVGTIGPVSAKTEPLVYLGYALGHSNGDGIPHMQI